MAGNQWFVINKETAGDVMPSGYTDFETSKSLLCIRVRRLRAACGFSSINRGAVLRELFVHADVTVL